VGSWGKITVLGIAAHQSPVWRPEPGKYDIARSEGFQLFFGKLITVLMVSLLLPLHVFNQNLSGPQAVKSMSPSRATPNQTSESVLTIDQVGPLGYEIEPTLYMVPAGMMKALGHADADGYYNQANTTDLEDPQYEDFLKKLAKISPNLYQQLLALGPSGRMKFNHVYRRHGYIFINVNISADRIEMTATHELVHRKTDNSKDDALMKKIYHFIDSKKTRELIKEAGDIEDGSSYGRLLMRHEIWQELSALTLDNSNYAAYIRAYFIVLLAQEAQRHPRHASAIKKYGDRLVELDEEIKPLVEKLMRKFQTMIDLNSQNHLGTMPYLKVSA
jgi:hypothetical protein